VGEAAEESRNGDQPSPREQRARHTGNGVWSNGPDDGARPRGPAPAKAGGKGRGGKRDGDIGRAVGGGKASKGRMAWRGSRFRDRWKRDEPQDRQRDETSPRDRRGASRRGGVKPRGRNAGGCGNPLRRPRKRPGVDSSVDVDGGADLWTTPGEETRRCESSGRKDREVPGKTARRSGGSRASR